ncbi:MAG: cytidylate kinase-like family protein [Clostridiales bacterium]|nr:cytidylate kinase-like family protein [Clostridiales bacterium]
MNICIGREFGSGGHEIGKSLAGELNLAFYDQEFVNQALADSGMDALSAARADEMKENPFLYQVWYSSSEIPISEFQRDCDPLIT